MRRISTYEKLLGERELISDAIKHMPTTISQRYAVIRSERSQGVALPL